MGVVVVTVVHFERHAGRATVGAAVGERREHRCPEFLAAGVPLRTLQEWMGHRDVNTTQVYADYQPDDGREAELVERAFAGRGPNRGPN